MKPQTQKQLNSLASYIAFLVGEYEKKNSIWRWFIFKMVKALKRTQYLANKTGTYTLAWRNPKDKKGLLMFDDIQPTGKIDNIKMTTPVKLNTKQVSGHAGQYENSSGSPLTVDYSVTRGRTTSKEESFELGFEQAFTSTTTIGNDNTPAKTELSATLGFNQSKTDTSSQEDSQENSASYSVTVAPYSSVSVTSSWSTSKVKQTVTGKAGLAFSIQIGKHWDGKWSGDRKWDTLDDLIKVLRGQAPDNLPLGEYFRSNPVPERKLKPLLKVSSLPFEQDLEWDDASDIVVRATDPNGNNVPIKPD